MLRGPQTPGELKQRSERLHSFADLAAVQGTLERLLERELVIRHPRRPGQKEERFEQVLGGAGEGAAEPAEMAEPTDSTAPDEAPEESATPSASFDDERLDRLERELSELRAQVASLREALGEG